MPAEATYNLARTVLRSRDAPPKLHLAAWRCLYHGDDRPLLLLCRLAYDRLQAEAPFYKAEGAVGATPPNAAPRPQSPAKEKESCDSE